MRNYRVFVVVALFTLVSLFGHARHAFAQDNDADVNFSAGNINVHEYAGNPPIETTPTDLDLVAVGTIVAIPRENIIKLDDGSIYKLENVRVPINYFPAVIEYLKRTLIGKKVGLYARDSNLVRKFDLSGNKLVQAVTADGTWVQADLVSHGMAWVSGSFYNRDLMIPLYKYEDAARAANLGLWADPQYTLKNEKTMTSKTYSSFQVYEGTVTSVAYASGYFFINFGANHDKDFTILMPRDVCWLFADAPGHNLDPRDWIGHKLRVRGWVEKNGGAMIRVTYPEQVQYLDKMTYHQ